MKIHIWNLFLFVVFLTVVALATYPIGLPWWGGVIIGMACGLLWPLKGKYAILERKSK